MNNPDERHKKSGIKVLSLLMAVMLWFYVVNQGGAATGQNYQQTKLNYYNLPAGLTVNGPEAVSVRIWGSARDNGNVIAYVDLTGLQPGVYHLAVKVKPLQGVMFATVQPDKVSIELKSQADRSFTVQYEVDRNLPEGKELHDVTLSPGQCIVKGEQDAVSKVASVHARINVGDTTGLISQQAVLVARDAQGKEISSGLQLIPTVVNVYAVADSKKISKELKVKLKFKGDPAAGYQLGTAVADPATVTVLGEETRLNNMEEISSQEIDLADHRVSFTQMVALPALEGMIIFPTQIKVMVNIEPVDSEVEP